MACVTKQKQKDRSSKKKELGPVLTLMALFVDSDAVAELFRMVRWINGVICPKCKKGKNVTKYCKYGPFQRYTCKKCDITFNDKTGTIVTVLLFEVI